MLDRFVLHNARRLGERTAFGSLMQQLTFLELEVRVSRLARILHGLRDYAPGLVAVQAADRRQHWMLLLALGRLGLASASLPETGDVEHYCDVLKPDLLLLHTQGHYTPLAGRDNVLVLDDAWFETVLKNCDEDRIEDAFPPVPVMADTLCRVAVAAGTDREMRSIGYSFSEIETALHRLIYQDMGEAVHVLALRDHLPEVLCTIDPAAMSGFLMVGGAIAAGTTARFADDGNIGVEVMHSKGLMAVLTPVHLVHLLNTLPPGMKPLEQLHLTVVGAPLSDAVLQRVYKTLTSHVHIVYGTDEAGLVAGIAADKRESGQSVGCIMPWASVEIVDEQGAVLPTGQTGIIRIRSFGPQAYLNAPPQSPQSYRDGWFWPGDRGFLSSRGELHLLGRVDDLVALGGSKFDLGVIDRMAREEKAVRDAGAFVVTTDDGEQHLYCAFVTQEELDVGAFVARVRGHYVDLPLFTAIWVNQIPHTEAGYTDRETLRRSYESHLKKEIHLREGAGLSGNGVTNISGPGN